MLTEPLEQLSGRAVTTLSVVVAYELTGFTAHCENNPSQAQLFDQHAAGAGGGEVGEQIVSCSGIEAAAADTKG